ncbi:MAG: PilZ domain-containing protein [Candidatus Omnitrophota bacterium]|nr:PilZ domain-containing protein [Candidatus Omnitrophota bacterium]
MDSIENGHRGIERRRFVRLPYRSPLKYKICKEDTIKKLMSGYTENISQSGLLCNINDQVPLDCVLWLALDMGILSICSEIERNSVILQHGILGRVIRTYQKKNGSFDVGVRFLTRSETDTGSLFQKAYVDEAMLGDNADR